MTTERYLEEWRTAELITAEQHALLVALVRKQRFSIFLELNALLYIGVVAVAAGIGWTVREHFARAGDVAVIVTLTAGFAACLWYCFSRGLPYSTSQVAAPTYAFDYVLYLGCLIFAAEVAYVEYRYQLLGVDWHYDLLASAALYLWLAYRFDNRFVLSLALSTLAGWFGVKFSGATFLAGSLRDIAVAYGVAVGGAGAVLRQLGIKPHFYESYLHVAANAILFGLASETLNRPNPWSLALLVIASGLVIERGVRFRRFAFVVYGALYGYVGVSAQALDVLHGETRVLVYFAVSAVMVVAGLIVVARQFGREE
ncbi:MAG TPA: DUF2157 domain-containing protein [Vicinamibacterales bacterium]|nr:DUF2157 domain-containing protein [Vicinamibacterales bacterium]